MSGISVEAIDSGRLSAVQTLLAFRVFGGDLNYVAELLSAARGVTYLALWGQDPAGFVTVHWPANHPLFQSLDIPEIRYLLVFGAFRRRGVGSRLMDAAEGWAGERSRRLGLGVGVSGAYGPAHQFYAQRGYLPTGEGLCRGHQPVDEGEVATVDDGLLFWLIKDLEPSDDRSGAPPGVG